MSTTDATSSRSAKHVPEWLNSPAWHSRPSHPVSPTLSRAQSKVEKEENKPTNPSLEDGMLKSEKTTKQAGDHPSENRSFYPNSSVSGETSSGFGAQHPSVAPQECSTSSDQLDSFSNSVDGKGSKTTISEDTRIQHFATELAKKRIHFAELQRLASEGIPDSGGLRSITWKLLLGYFPKNRELWRAEASKKRAEYAAFREELLVNPSELTRKEGDWQVEMCQTGGVLPRQEISHGDHPLSLRKTSIWNQFFQAGFGVGGTDRS